MRLILVRLLVYLWTESSISLYVDRREPFMSLPSGAVQGKRMPNEATAAGAAGLRAFVRIAQLWDLSVA